MATVKLDPAKGIQIPNLTTTERNAISSPETGAIIWNTTTSEINQYNGSAWGTVGISEDTTKLPLAGGTLTGNTTIATNSTPKLILKRTGNNAGNGYIECHGADDSVDYKIAFAQSNGVMSFDVGGTRMLGVTSDGLCFNSDTAAANALDDYEEGTWTPTVTGGTMGTNNRSCYTKIGNKVWLYTYMNFTAPNNGTMFQIKGIPYTPASHMHAGGSVEYAGSRDFRHWSAPLIDGAGIYFHRKDGTGAVIANNEFGGSSQVIIVSVTYTTS